MAKKPELKIFDPKKNITLTTDASEYSDLKYYHKDIQ